MFYIGCHLSVSGGYEAMGKTALSIGANTFQYFTRNPRGRGFKRPDGDDVAALNALIAENGFAPPLAHAPYTFNPASADERIWNYSRDSMREDIEVLEDIPGALYNFHPGCHVGIGAEAGIENTARLLSEVITPGQNARVLITNYDALVSVYLVIAVIYILINVAINKAAIYVSHKTGATIIR